MISIRQLFRYIALFTLLMVTVSSLFAEEVRKDVVIGEERTISSKVLNEDRTIMISKPYTYDTGNERYPVLIVLSSNMFPHASAVTRFMASEQLYPDMLVVGVSMAPRTRTRDLTPIATYPKTKAQVPTGGGAANFRSFLADELLPWLDQNYRTRPYKVLVGHSYGGLFAIDTMLTQPTLFNAYVAISPSLWWDNEKLVERTDTFLKTKPDLNSTLYLSVSSGDNGELRGSVRKLAGVLEARSPAGLNWHMEELANETHDSGALIGTQQGLEFLFADWALPNGTGLYDLGGIEAVEHFYARKDQKYGYGPRDVSINAFQSVAGKLLESGRLDDIAGLLTRYRDTVHPPARNLVQLADAYRGQGRNDRAIDFYQQALKADPRHEAAKKALTELGAK